jgi:DNA-binding MarR family transcriptional regulator
MMSAREKVWRYVEANRKGNVFHGTAREISERVGVSQGTVDVILKDWHETGALIRVRLGCRRVVSVPDMRIRRATWDEDALSLLRLSERPSRKELAARLHKTRNAVHGMIWRMERKHHAEGDNG